MPVCARQFSTVDGVAAAGSDTSLLLALMLLTLHCWCWCFIVDGGAAANVVLLVLLRLRQAEAADAVAKEAQAAATAATMAAEQAAGASAQSPIPGSLHAPGPELEALQVSYKEAARDVLQHCTASVHSLKACGARRALRCLDWIGRALRVGSVRTARLRWLDII